MSRRCRPDALQEVLLPRPGGDRRQGVRPAARGAEQANKVGIAKVSFRDKEHLAALRFSDDAFSETMYWPDEIARPTTASTSTASTRQRTGDAQTLIDNLGTLEPRRVLGRVRESLLRVVEAKIDGEEIEVVEAEPAAQVVDLMEALKASVAAAGKGQGRPKKDDRSQVHRQVDQEGLAAQKAVE